MSASTDQQPAARPRHRAIRRWLGYSALALGALLLGAVGFKLWYDRAYDRALVAGILNLEATPWSVADIDCDSVFTTDVLTTCAFEVAPADFPKLVVGWQLQPEDPYYKRAHDFPMALDRGPNFEIRHHFFAEPPQFPHGGSVDLFADSTYSRVLVHLYVE